MQEHIDKLPDEPELEELRETAQKFVKDVRASGASEAMAAAEAALAEFAGTAGHKKAKEAADILDKFLEVQVRGRRQQLPRVHSRSSRACATRWATRSPNCWPAWAWATAAAVGGYGMVGLYGGLPEMFGGRKGDAGPRPARPKAHGRRRPARAATIPTTRKRRRAVRPGAAAGASEGAVPVRYRRQVGQYFQRVAEETGEGGR